MPRGAVISSAADVSAGSQSKMIPSPSPMTTVAPGTRTRAEQLVLDAELLEAIGEVADGLLVLEVGLLTQRTGFSPRMR